MVLPWPLVFTPKINDNRKSGRFSIVISQRKLMTIENHGDFAQQSVRFKITINIMEEKSHNQGYFQICSSEHV